MECREIAARALLEALPSGFRSVGGTGGQEGGDSPPCSAANKLRRTIYRDHVFGQAGKRSWATDHLQMAWWCAARAPDDQSERSVPPAAQAPQG